MLKEAVLVFFALVAFSMAYPAEEDIGEPPNVFAVEPSPDKEPLLEPESLEGAESANPWGHRRYGGYYGRGWGGRGYGFGWGGGGWGRGYGYGWGGGYHRRGYGWGK